jgi:putative ABC transport system substrate-binding protein
MMLLGGAAMTAPLAARAQQTAMPVVGFLRSTSPTEATHLLAAFQRGMREAGYVEEQNLTIEYRWGEDRHDRMPALAAELIQRRVALIVAAGNEAVAAAKATTDSIPIVFALGDDPVELGFVASLSRPGGNVTGVTFVTSELVGKRMELLTEMVPRVTLIGYFMNADNPGAELELREVQTASHSLGVQVLVLKTGGESDFTAGAKSLAQHRVGALIVGSGAFFFGRRDRLAALAARLAIPAVYDLREYVAAGGLLSYGASITDAYRRLGVYAARILKGTKPADLPVEQPTKFELVINLKTATALGLTVPQTLLARADEVIE